MPCYKPLEAWRGRELNPKTGKYPMVFNRNQGYSDLPSQKLPCGRCIGCRLERSRQWAIRCVHEAQLHEQNCFITLTYSPENLPFPPSLDVRHYQLFMKRLRKKYGSNIRFFHCGEYGDQLGRPHYHACLFGFDFPDKVHWKTTKRGDRLYTSESLNKIWGKGYAIIGDVTFESAAYVARYITKKITGDAAADHYERHDPDTGELYSLKPEYTTMSRRPGIAKDWYDKYSSDVYPHDEVIMRGMKMKPPKYYDRQYELTNPKEFEKMKMQRRVAAKSRSEDSTPERLAVREKVKLAKIKQLKRTYEHD